MPLGACVQELPVQELCARSTLNQTRRGRWSVPASLADCQKMESTDSERRGRQLLRSIVHDGETFAEGFARVDVNGDGLVTADELEQAGCSGAIIEELLALGDTDHDGKISLGEFLELAQLEDEISVLQDELLGDDGGVPAFGGVTLATLGGYSISGHPLPQLVSAFCVASPLRHVVLAADSDGSSRVTQGLKQLIQACMSAPSGSASSSSRLAAVLQSEMGADGPDIFAGMDLVELFLILLDALDDPISACFTVKTSPFMQCLTTRRIHPREEGREVDFSLNTHKNDFEAALAASLGRGDTIEDFHCEECNVQGDCKFGQFLLGPTPQIVVLNMARLQFDLSTGRVKFDTSPVDVPEHLSFDRFIDPKQADPGPAHSYTLIAAFCYRPIPHRGGVYDLFVRSPEHGGARAGGWLHAFDDTVRAAQPAEVHSKARACATMLWYHRA